MWVCVTAVISSRDGDGADLIIDLTSIWECGKCSSQQLSNYLWEYLSIRSEQEEGLKQAKAMCRRCLSCTVFKRVSIVQTQIHVFYDFHEYGTIVNQRSYRSRVLRWKLFHKQLSMYWHDTVRNTGNSTKQIIGCKSIVLPPRVIRQSRASPPPWRQGDSIVS
jgi:hypothetical protein